MWNRRARAVSLTLAMSLVIMSFTAGCDNLKKPVGIQETEPPAETETEPPTETETETETESETELRMNVAFTSQDRSIRITLPDSTWTVQQDADEMRVFSSGNAAMISIVHAGDAVAMKNISVAESEEALNASLTGQYPGTNAFEVVDFRKRSSGSLNTYEYVVKYNATSMWAYSVTYGILATDQAYVITGTVLNDNAALLDVVKKAVESFTVLRNGVFSAIPGTVVSQSESQSESDARVELASLSDYGTSVMLYASDVVNVRQQPSTSSAILVTLNAGDQVSVVGETPQWFKVNINGNIGYISKAFLVRQPTQQTETQPGSEVTEDTKVSAEMNSYVEYETGYTYYTTTDVNMRTQPGTESSVVNTLGAGAAVTVIGETANWFMVSVNGVTGYITKSYVSSTDPGISSGGNTGDNGGETGGNTGNNGDTPNTDVGPVSGTIMSVGTNTIMIQADDGNIYSINYTDASVTTSSGLQEGLYVSAMIDYSNTLPNGDLYATDVSGN